MSECATHAHAHRRLSAASPPLRSAGLKLSLASRYPDAAVAHSTAG
jgi:hypothetical protein